MLSFLSPNCKLGSSLLGYYYYYFYYFLFFHHPDFGGLASRMDGYIVW